MAPCALVSFRFDASGPERTIVDVLESHRQHLSCPVNSYVAKKLQPEAGREVVALLVASGALEDNAGTERSVKRGGRPGSRMDGAGNKFPEWLEVRESRIVRIEIMRRRVVQIGSKPQRVANAGVSNERQQIGNLYAAAKGGVDRGRAGSNCSERRVGRDHFPGCRRTLELALKPGKLHRTKQIGVRAVMVFWNSPVWTSVAAHIKQKQIEKRTVGNLPVYAAAAWRYVSNRDELVKRAASARGKKQCAFLIVIASVNRLARPPVLHHLMIVPLCENRHLGIEAAHIHVE